MSPPSAAPRRVLLFAEAVTLAHVARPLCVARGLDRARYRTAIAAAHWAAGHVTEAGIEHLPLESVEPRRFLSALARGRALYDESTLQRYVRADLALIERHAPDLVIGDFRLSLSVSARLAGVPYVTISSAYWSPYYAPPRWPVPDLPLTRWLPIGLAQAAFDAARPLAFALHCGPLNRLRRRNGLAPLPRDLRRVYTDADFVVYSDLPQLFPTTDLPSTHRFLGPALWQPGSPPPAWWDKVPDDRPCVYVTLGSSGAAQLLPRIVGTLARLPLTLLVATAGAALPPSLPRNVLAAPYLPGLQAARRSSVVVCNGGSLTAYQALAAGAQVLGVAGNLDQFLNMQGFERVGAGRTMRADTLSERALAGAVEQLRQEASDRARAARWIAECERLDFARASAEAVAQLCPG